MFALVSVFPAIFAALSFSRAANSSYALLYIVRGAPAVGFILAVFGISLGAVILNKSSTKVDQENKEVGESISEAQSENQNLQTDEAKEDQ